MKKYFSFVKSMWFLIALGMIFNLLFGVLKTEGAVYIQKLTDTIESDSMGTIPWLILIGGGLTFLSFIIRWLGAVMPKYLACRFTYETKQKLFDHLSKIPFLKYESYSVGELQSRFQNDTDRAGHALFVVLSRILNNVFLFIFSIFAMAATDVLVTVIAVVIVVIATAVNQYILKNMKKREKESQANLAKMTRSLERIFSAIETVKTAGADDYVRSLYTEKQEAYCDSKMIVTIIGSVRTLWYSVTENICLYGSICYLGVLGIQGRLTIGEVLMFIYLVKQIIMPIEVVFRWLASLPGCSASMERVSELMDIEQTDSLSRHKEFENAETACVHHIHFGYSDKEPLFSGLSLDFRKGQLSLISGDSGSGKTTLLKIIAGLYHSEQAEYQIDHNTVSPFSPEDIAYASIDRSVFPMSIYENVALGNTEITREQVENALCTLGFGDWIEALPKGLDTQVYENISGGQKQAIANARAILSGRKVLIFDEPFSALDIVKERNLINTLEKLTSTHFVILVSHRAVDMSKRMPRNTVELMTKL